MMLEFWKKKKRKGHEGEVSYKKYKEEKWQSQSAMSLNVCACS